MLIRILKSSKIIFGLAVMFTMGLKCNINASDHNKACDHDEIHPQYAKIHIWQDNAQAKRAGHVSLQTTDTYVSIRPDLQSEHTTFTDSNNISRCWLARALRIDTYDKDQEIEGRPADLIYNIKLNTVKLKEKWQKLTILWDKSINPNQADIESSKTCEYPKWFIAADLTELWQSYESGPTILISDGLAVVFALACGKISIEKITESKVLAKAWFERDLFARSIAKTDEQRIMKLMTEDEKYNCFYYPKDFDVFLQTHIKDRVINEISDNISKGTLSITSPAAKGETTLEINQAEIKHFVGSLPPVFNEQTVLKDSLSTSGILTEKDGKYKLSLNEHTSKLLFLKRLCPWCTLL
jgi:hypothetical protein